MDAIGSRRVGILARAMQSMVALPHQVRRARAFRADPDRCAAQIRKGVKGVARSPEKYEGFRFGQPTKELEPSISRHRRAVLDEGEFFGAPSPSIGQAADVLD